jgi:hypothetical protein
MGYSDNDGMVRVDYFKPTGKWYMTEAIDMSSHWQDVDMFKAIELSLDESRPDRSARWWKSFTVVVLEPYHVNSYPVMFVGESWV